MYTDPYTDQSKFTEISKLDVSNKITKQVTTLPNGKTTNYYLQDYGSSIEIVSSYMVETTPVLLHINVPDGQHYKIRYTYTVSGYTSADTSGNGGDTIYFSNKAKFQTDTASSESKTNHDQMNVQQSNMQTSTDTYPQIYKVDVNNDGSNLNATFIVAPKLIQFDSRMIGLKMPILRCFMKSSFSSVSRISARYSSICRP